MELKQIARIENDFSEKFGIPRQSGLVATKGTIIFEKEYQNPDSLRGLEEYSHIWVIWGFSGNPRKQWKATVRPPRLGGNTRKGVFATRSPFRPNPLGLSCLRLLEICKTENQGYVLKVEGADMLSGTPIYDIKPYLSYVDCKEGANSGFADLVKEKELMVSVPEQYEQILTQEQLQEIKELLAQDPRPSYQEESERIYGMNYAGFEIRFQVKGLELIVCEITKEGK